MLVYFLTDGIFEKWYLNCGISNNFSLYRTSEKLNYYQIIISSYY